MFHDRTAFSLLISVPRPPRAWIDRPWAKWLLDIPATCRRMSERQRQRRALLELDDRMLADIGVSRAQALRTGRRPWWR
jgi:uncharacterized protein YjiS (DUF1127 family)